MAARNAARVLLRPAYVPRLSCERVLRSTSAPAHFPIRRLSASARLRANADAFVNTLDPDPSAIVIRSVSAERGLTLSDGTRIRTAALFINDVAFLWHPPPLADADLRWTDWTPDDFAALEIVEPRPDVLVVGTGPTLVPMPSNLRAYLSSLGVAVDIQDTRNACATYNLMREEGRTVAAAILPMTR